MGESVEASVTSTPPTMDRRPSRTARSTSMPHSAKTSRARSALRTAATTVLRLSGDCDVRRYFTICLPTLPEAPKTATASLRGGGGGAVADAEEEDFFSVEGER